MMETPRKRHRRSWACLECRRRKLQCDRTRPCCKRCSISGRASTCQYADAAATTDTNDSLISQSHEIVAFGARQEIVPLGVTTSPALQSGDTPSHELLAQLQKKVRSLETALAEKSVPQPDTTAADIFGGPWTDSSVVEFRGSSFQTYFRGPTLADGLAARIPGLSSFSEEAFAACTTIDRIKHAASQSEPTVLPQLSPERSSIDTLLYFLPARMEADRYISAYFDGMDHIFHVIHRPSFESEYTRLWLDQAAADPEFVIMVLLMLAIAYCTTAEVHNLYENNEDAPRVRAKRIAETCEAWINSRVETLYYLRSFQIHFLLLLTKQLNGRRFKRTWINAGGFVRACMCRGLHRDPRALGSETTRMDREMRKRLWAASAEFELQAAFDHGMEPMSWQSQSDTGPPSNIKDLDLEQRVLDPPSHAYTAVSFLTIAGESLRFRHELNTALNTVNQVLTFEQTKSYADQLFAYVQAIPQWTGSHPTVMKALLSITLEQYLLALFEQRMRNADSSYEKQFMRVSLMEAAFRIVEYHKAAIAAGSRIIELLYGDHIRVALSICTAYVSAEPGLNNVFISLEHDALRVMEELINITSDKVRRFGHNRRTFLVLCAASGLMRTAKDPAGRSTFIQQTVDRFARTFDELLQQPRPEIQAGAEPMDGQFNVVGNPFISPMCDDLLDWALDDWSFGINLNR